MNSIVENLDFKGLKEIYMVSNTPDYLFKKFRELASVQTLSQKNNVEALQNILTEIASEPISEIHALISVYAILVALSFKPVSQIKTLLENLELQIQWGDRLKSIVLAHADQLNETRAIINFKLDAEKSHTRVPFSTSETLINI